MKYWISLLRYQVRADLQNLYVGSLLGGYWSIINPLLQVGIYVFLFGFVLRMQLGGTSSPFEYSLFCLAGLGAWISFQAALTGCALSVARNAAIVKNVSFPVVLFPISSVVCSFVTLGVTYAALLILLALIGHSPGWSIAALPFVILAHSFLALGIGLILAVVGAFVRDIAQVLPMILQIWMLATPVVYEVSDMPAGLQFLAVWNPLYFVIDGYRRILYYGIEPQWIGVGGVALAGGLLTVLGLKLMMRTRGYFEAVV